MSVTNERAVIGGNTRDANEYMKEVMDRLALDYSEMAKSAALITDEAESLPEEVSTEDDLRKFSDVVVRIRDLGARADSTRKAEKEPYLRGGQAVDGYFNGIIERLDKTVKMLTRRVNSYQQRKLAEERERRRLEAEETARRERAAAEAAAEANRVAEEARLAADRARNPGKVAEKSAIATAAETAAGAATAAAAVAADNAQDAYIDTLRKPSEIARSRFDEGRLVTMKQVGHAEIVDKMKLDPVALWPFIKEDAALRAIKEWAKTYSFKRPMDGAIIEMRDDTVIR